MQKKKVYHMHMFKEPTGRTRSPIPIELSRDMGIENGDPINVTRIGDNRILITLKEKKEEK
jgi:bifunctional DNA-binding transcriptional regulator/antitoxin component of YhaV-PrlF toxin-antitoxin module